MTRITTLCLRTQPRVWWVAELFSSLFSGTSSPCSLSSSTESSSPHSVVTRSSSVSHCNLFLPVINHVFTKCSRLYWSFQRSIGFITYKVLKTCLTLRISSNIILRYVIPPLDSSLVSEALIIFIEYPYWYKSINWLTILQSLLLCFTEVF